MKCTTTRRARVMLSLASPFANAPGTVHIPGSGSAEDEVLVRALCGGQPAGPFILDSGGLRHLFFTLDAVQSSMRLAAPDEIVPAYARKMMAFLLFNRTPRHILIIGMGGGSLVKFCHRHLPTTCLSVIEVDPDVVGLRDWFCIPPDDERLRIIPADGAEFVARGEWRGEILLIDAFDSAGVASSLASNEFYSAAFRCLEPEGVLVMNLAGARTRYVAHLQQLRAACPGPILLVPVESDGNLLVFAFARATARQALALVEGVAQRLQSELDLEFPHFLQRLRAGHVFKG